MCIIRNIQSHIMEVVSGSGLCVFLLKRGISKDFFVSLPSNFFYASREPYTGEEAAVKKKAKRMSAQQMR